MAGAGVVVVTDANFEQEVLKSDVPVLVDFWAIWCGPCKALGPTIDSIADSFAGKLKVAKMNVDENTGAPSLRCRYSRVMSSRSFFIHTSDDALRHITQLAKGLKKVGFAGLVGGAGCGVMALLLGRVLLNSGTQSNALPGFHEMSGITFIATFMAAALIVFSILYLVASWGLSHQQSWARYTAAGTFAAKLLLCVWLGRSSVIAMILFLMVAGWDIYGLWVLLSKETGQLFTSPHSTQVSAKPANLVT